MLWDKDDSRWRGRIGETEGFIPASYVEVLNDETASSNSTDQPAIQPKDPSRAGDFSAGKIMLVHKELCGFFREWSLLGGPLLSLQTRSLLHGIRTYIPSARDHLKNTTTDCQPAHTLHKAEEGLVTFAWLREDRIVHFSSHTH